MKLYQAVSLAVAVFVAQPVIAEEKDANLSGFKFKVPADWKRVGEQSKFVDKDGFISPKFFDLAGKEMPIAVISHRIEREPELTEKSIEKKLRESVKEALEKAKVDLDAPDYVGPKVLKTDLDGCVFTARKIGKGQVYTSTFIVSNKGDGDESLVMKSTTVTYVDADHIYVLMIYGVVQHYRYYAKEIREIAESAKPKRG